MSSSAKEADMPRDEDIAMSWFVKVESRVYGPYTPVQMSSFVSEGRIAAHSQISKYRDRDWGTASEVAEFAGWAGEVDKAPTSEKRITPGVRTANFVIIAEIHSENGAEFTTALASYGDLEAITDGVWLLRGQTTAGVLRNELSHALDRDDKLMVVDASRDRSAWFNLGSDADTNIRALWGQPN
ncbi:MAG: DUF4339 domain-containing protein [Maricaulis sp.]|jgi:hypothetical protein|nr:DUF4339 domain-containing protein [Maricaulis sp.]MDG2044190.1 DUF4339 domain-containing protein [Maricaulis sp.]